MLHRTGAWLATLFAFALACTLQSTVALAQPTTGTVQVNLTNGAAGSGTPVQGADVQIGGTKTTTDDKGSASKDGPTGTRYVLIKYKGRSFRRVVQVEAGKTTTISLGTDDLVGEDWDISVHYLGYPELVEQANKAAKACDAATYNKAKGELEKLRKAAATEVDDLQKAVEAESASTGLPADEQQLDGMINTIEGTKQAGGSVDREQEQKLRDFTNTVHNLNSAKSVLSAIEGNLKKVNPLEKCPEPSPGTTAPKPPEKPPEQKAEPKKDEKKEEKTGGPGSMAPFGNGPTFAVAVLGGVTSFSQHINSTVVTSSAFPDSTDVSGSLGLIGLDARALIPVTSWGGQSASGQPATFLSLLFGAELGTFIGSPPSAFQSHPKIDNTISATPNWEAAFYGGVSLSLPMSPSPTVSVFGGVDLQTVTLNQTADQSRFGAGVVGVSQQQTMARPMIGVDVEVPVGAAPVQMFARAGVAVVFPGTASANFTTSIPAALTGMGNYTTVVPFDTEVRGEVAFGVRF